MRRGTILLLILLFIPNVSAASIGVSKAAIDYDDVLKGGYSETSFVVTTDSEEPVSIEYEFLDEISNWLSLESDGDFYVARGEPETLTLIVEPPLTVPNGVYEGVLRITTGQLAKNDGQFGSIIRTAFRIKVKVVVTGRQIQDCNIGGVNIYNSEFDQDLELRATINNRGNVDLNPTFEIDVWNQQQTRLIQTIIVPSNNNFRPSQTKTISDFFEHDFSLGQYFADIKVQECGKQISDSFQILDRGEIADEGELINIYNEAWAKVNDIIPVNANFRNKGERTVNAKLKGSVLLNGNVIKVIDTDAISVAPGETVKLETFVNPTQPGQYLVKLRALYNNKLTFEKESLINVNPTGENPNYTNSRTEWYPIIMVVLAITLVTLLLMIKKRKQGL